MRNSYMALPSGEHSISVFVVNPLRKGATFEKMLYSLTTLFDALVKIGVASPVTLVSNLLI